MGHASEQLRAALVFVQRFRGVSDAVHIGHWQTNIVNASGPRDIFTASVHRVCNVSPILSNFLSLHGGEFETHAIPTKTPTQNASSLPHEWRAS